MAMITGVTGRNRSYLTELLLAKGYEVHDVMRRASLFTCRAQATSPILELSSCTGLQTSGYGGNPLAPGPEG